ncbi:MAG: 6-phospho-beta-glucosidase [Chloroflexi bacterium]|nr:6-phospho-beta-glucosidase [Chloroflexota bacterium]
MLKVAVIGGGSSYTPELVQGFLDRVETFPLDELWLVDISQERLEIVGGFAQRMAQARGAPFRVRTTTNRLQGLESASYVLTQLRVGGMAARREDEYLGRRWGLVGQETTGVGGMAKALRTIPVILDIAADMRQVARGALLVNFTNPAGLITEALSRYAADIPAVGVCNVPITAKMTLIQKLEKRLGRDIDPQGAQLDTLGLNHLSWHRGLTVDGKDYWNAILESYILELRRTDEPEWPAELIETLGMIPNYYLQYYYFAQKKIAEQAAWDEKGSRAEQVMAIEKDLLAQYADPTRSSPPADLMKRGGAWYSTLATQLLAAHYNDSNEVHVLNVPHHGAVAGWPKDWVLEMPCRVNAAGIEPLPTEPLPQAQFGLLAHVKSYELLTVEAAVHGDRRTAYQALLAHPLGPPADKIPAVLADMLKTNKPHLPRFGAAQTIAGGR